MTNPRFAFAIVVALLLLLAPKLRAEEVDNPAYLTWTKFGLQSSETLAGTVNAGQMQITMEMTRKLAEKTADHVTIETSSVVQVMGQNRPSPVNKTVIKAKAEKTDVTDLGNEDVVAAGKTYTCHVYEVKGMNAQSAQAKTKIWTHPDVPGGIVKMDIAMPQGAVTMLLQKVDAK